MAQGSPKRPKVIPGVTQDAPMKAKGALKDGQREPKGTPQGAKGSPKSPQRKPKAPQLRYPGSPGWPVAGSSLSSLA